MPGKINGFSVAYTAIGGILVWSGIKGWTLSTTFQDLLQGKTPTANQENVGVPSLNILDNAGGSSSPSSGSSPDTSGMPSGTAAQNQAIAKVLAAPYGWSTGTNWTDLVNLWNRESGWNNKAKNPSSGAYGIPQALPASKLPAKGQPPTSDASSQISWGLSYIKSTYGSPSAAWAHEQSAGWY